MTDGMKKNDDSMNTLISQKLSQHLQPLIAQARKETELFEDLEIITKFNIA